MKLILKNITNIIILLFLLSFTILSYFVFRLNILPTKYLISGFSISILIIIILLLGVSSKKHKILKILSQIIMLLLSFTFGYISYYLNNTYSFLNST